MKSPITVTATMDHSSGHVRFEMSWPCLDKHDQPSNEYVGFFIKDNVTVYEALQGLARSMQEELNVVVPPAPAAWLPKAEPALDATQELPAAGEEPQA